MRQVALILASLQIAIWSVPSLAQEDASETLGVSGSAPQVCTIASGRFRTGELLNFVGADSDTLRVIELLDPRDLSARAARATISFEAVCNFPHRVRLESQENGLWPVSGPLSPDQGGFATALPYAVSLNWADRAQLLETDAKIRRQRVTFAEIDEPAVGDMTVAISLDAGASNTQSGAPVLAGAYSDVLRIYLEPR